MSAASSNGNEQGSKTKSIYVATRNMDDLKTKQTKPQIRRIAVCRLVLFSKLHVLCHRKLYTV